MKGRFGNDDAMSIAKDEAEAEMRDAVKCPVCGGSDWTDKGNNVASCNRCNAMNPAKRLQAEIEATLLRNLAILVEGGETHNVMTFYGGITTLAISDVERMLKACAANLSMTLAPRMKQI